MKPLALLLSFCLIGFCIACSDDDKPAAPEILRSGSDSDEDIEGARPEIVSGGSGNGSAGINLGPLAQVIGAVSTEGHGLTLSRTETEVVAADSATLVVILQSQPSGPSPVAQLTARDRQVVIDAARAAGFGEDTVTIQTLPSFGPFS